jgi:adenine-specific DNA glycosylase
MASALEERFGGQVPTELSDLVTMPGVGRKTGNVVRSVDFGLPGLPVDTHVLRVSKRLGLTELDDPVKVELALERAHPAAERGAFSLRVILHGRATCTARRPACSRCVLADICPSAHLGGPDRSQFSRNSIKDARHAAQLEKGRDYNVLGTGSRHLVPKRVVAGIRLPDDPPMPALRGRHR